MPKFMIGTYTFPTKGAAFKAVQQVLNNNPIGIALAGKDLELIRALAYMHSNADEKLAGGCASIEIRLNEFHGLPTTKGFWIVHDDGSSIDFSIKNPFQNKDARRTGMYRAAGRIAIRPLMMDYKKKNFNGSSTVQCAITGVALKWEEADVHHGGAWPYKRILEEWLAAQPTPPQLIDRGLYHEMNANDAASFLAWHNERAVFQIIHKAENSRLGARGK